MVSYFELLYHTIMVPGIYQALVSYVVRSVFLRHWQAAHREVQTEDRVMHGLAVITLACYGMQQDAYGSICNVTRHPTHGIRRYLAAVEASTPA